LGAIVDGSPFANNLTDEPVTITGSSGTGATGTVNTSGSGVITGAGVTITAAGSGYFVGETVTITNGSGTATSTVATIT